MTVKAKLYWNQWLVGAMYDDRNIMGNRWLVLILGPLAVSFGLGRKP